MPNLTSPLRTWFCYATWGGNHHFPKGILWLFKIVFHSLSLSPCSLVKIVSIPDNYSRWKRHKISLRPLIAAATILLSPFAMMMAASRLRLDCVFVVPLWWPALTASKTWLQQWRAEFVPLSQAEFVPLSKTQFRTIIDLRKKVCIQNEGDKLTYLVLAR